MISYFLNQDPLILEMLVLLLYSDPYPAKYGERASDLAEIANIDRGLQTLPIIERGLLTLLNIARGLQTLMNIERGLRTLQNITNIERGYRPC